MKRVLFALTFTMFLVSGSFGSDLAISPILGAPGSGCMLSATSTIVISVLNTEAIPYGGTTTLTYSLNGGPIITESITTPFMSYAVLTYSFTTPADLSACQVHSITCTVSITGDTDLSNNTQVFSVTSDCAPITGTVSAPAEVCQNLNSGSLNLTGYTGNIVSWIYSTDAGMSWSWAGNSPSQPYSNINVAMEWAVIVGSPFGLCANDTSWAAHIDVVPQTIAGNLPANFDICTGANAGALNLTGYLGTILGWEFSQDNGFTWAPVSNTSDELLYANLTDTTLYQVLVQNGVCPAVYTTPVTLTLVPGSDAGTITGELLVCNFENDSSLQANPISGNVIGWNVSTDNGTTWISTGVTGPVYDYAGLNTYTLFAALVQQGTCPIDTVYHSIVVLPLNPLAGTDITINEGDSVQLNASGGSYFSWSPDANMSDPNIGNPVVWPPYTTEYTVVVTDINGCSDTASVTVTVKPDLYALNIPNLLTPNGDGFNEILVIPNIESYPKNEILIFNSYGQVIFRASPYNNDWTSSFKGNSVPDGTYYYVLDLHEEQNQHEAIQGIITVMGN